MLKTLFHLTDYVYYTYIWMHDDGDGSQPASFLLAFQAKNCWHRRCPPGVVLNQM